MLQDMCNGPKSIKDQLSDSCSPLQHLLDSQLTSYSFEILKINEPLPTSHPAFYRLCLRPPSTPLPTQQLVCNMRHDIRSETNVTPSTFHLVGTYCADIQFATKSIQMQVYLDSSHSLNLRQLCYFKFQTFLWV